MQENCKGEVHFIGNAGEVRIEFVDPFQFPKRKADEALVDFKERVTDIVKRSCFDSIGREIVIVKWIGPLGYHHGYVHTR